VTSYRIWPATDGPGTEDNADPVTLGTRFTLSATGWATHIHYWRSSTSDTGTHNAAIFKVSDGSVVTGTTVVAPASGIGWQTVALPAPVQLDAATMYCVAVHHPDGHPPFTGSYWVVGGPGATGITNGILTAPNSADAGGQGVFNGGSSLAHPTGSFNQTNYWVDVTVSDTDPNAPIFDSAADTIGLTDAVTKAVDYVRTPADTIGITDTATAAVDYQRSTADTVGLTDAAAAAMDWNRGPADTIGITDQATAILDHASQPADAVGITDAVTTALDAVRTPADTVGLTDQATAALDAIRGLGDTVGISDSVTAVLGTPGQPDPDWDFRLGAPYADSYRLGPPHD